MKSVRPLAAILAVTLGIAAPGFAQVDMPPPRTAPASPQPPEILDRVPIALIEDLGSGRILYSREADRRFIPASLTKLMTVYTAFELLKEKRIVLNQQMPVRYDTFKEWSGKGSSMFVRANSSISVDDLLKGIVTVSANDGSIVLAEGIAGSVQGFATLMNAKARELGMNDSHFNTPNGWPDEGRTYTSARDLAKLATALATRHPELYAYYFSIPEFTWNDITQKNRNPVIGAVRGADGLKTGFTNEAGYGFVGSAQRNGRRLVMVVGGAESSRLRKAAAREFLEWGFDAWDAQLLFGNAHPLAEARVQGGTARTVPLVAALPVFQTVPHGGKGDPTVTVRYRGPLQAPIKEGETVAELLIQADGAPARAIPLVTANAVEEGDFWDRLRDGFLGLFT